MEEGCSTLLLFKCFIGHLLRVNHVFASENGVKKIKASVQKCGCGNTGTVQFVFVCFYGQFCNHISVVNSLCVWLAGELTDPRLPMESKFPYPESSCSAGRNKQVTWDTPVKHLN